MAVAFDAVGPSSAGASSASSTTLSWSHTCGATSALVVGIAVGVATDTAFDVSVKLDPSGANTTMVALGPEQHSGGITAGFMQLFGLSGVAAGAHTITATATGGTPISMEGGSLSYSNTHATSALGNYQGANSAGAVFNQTLTHTGSTSGNMVAAFCVCGDVLNSPSAGTSRFILNLNTSSAAGNYAGADLAAGGSQAFTWSNTSGGGDSMSIGAVEIYDAASAGAPPQVARIAVTTGAPATAAAFSPTLPTHATGDRMILAVVGKYETTTVPTINQSWVLVGSGTGGTGAAAADTGQTFWAVYAKDATSGAETAPTVTPGGTAPNSWEWICATHRPASGLVWADAIGASVAWVQSASDTTTASPLTGTCGAWTGVQPTDGDAIFAVGVIPTDLGSALGATTITATGLSGGTKDTATSQYIENALNADTAAVWAGWTQIVGTASAGLALSFTVTGATNQSGSLIGVALRQQAVAVPSNPKSLNYQTAVRRSYYM